MPIWDQVADFEEGDDSDFDSVAPDWDQEAEVTLALDEFDAAVPAWDAYAPCEEEDLSEFDDIGISWDKYADFEEGDTTDFDIKVDGDGDLNAAQAAAKEGDWGIELTFDDANAMYGQLVQTTGSNIVTHFWINQNDLVLANDKVIEVCYLYSSTAQHHGAIRLWKQADVWYITCWISDDTDTWQKVGNSVAIDVGWHHVMLMAKKSTGVGANDGYAALFVDHVQSGETKTGLDDDLKNWSYGLYGMVWTNAVAFGGSYYMDEIYIGYLGACWVSDFGAHDGEHGLSIPMGIYVNTHVTLALDAIDQTSCVAACWFDVNSVPLTTDTSTFIIVGRDGGGVFPFSVVVSWDGSDYDLRLYYRDDAAVAHLIGTTVITDEPHHIMVYWKAATAPDADDGICRLLVDGVLEVEATDLDTDTRDIDDVDFGKCHTNEALTLVGIMYMDELYVDTVGGPMGLSGFGAGRGDYGLAIPAADTTGRYVGLHDPVTDTFIVMEMSFNLSGLYPSMVEGNSWPIMIMRRTGGGEGFRVGPQRTAGGIRLVAWAMLDSITWDTGQVSATFDPDVWHHLRVAFKTSSGADDGWYCVFLDGHLVISRTGLDNDTITADGIWYGASNGLDAETIGLLLIDDMRWSDGPRHPPWIIPDAAYEGSYGCGFTTAAVTSPSYAQLLDPDAEGEVCVDFRLYIPDDFVMAVSDNFMVSDMVEGGTRGAYLSLIGAADDQIYIALAYQDNLGGWHGTGDAIPLDRDTWYHVRYYFKQATGDGEEDGVCALWIDEVLLRKAIDCDTDEIDIGEIRFGFIGVDVGTYGCIWLDFARWSNDALFLAASKQMRYYRRVRIPGPVTVMD